HARNSDNRRPQTVIRQASNNVLHDVVDCSPQAIQATSTNPQPQKGSTILASRFRKLTTHSKLSALTTATKQTNRVCASEFMGRSDSRTIHPVHCVPAGSAIQTTPHRRQTQTVRRPPERTAASDSATAARRAVHRLSACSAGRH